MSSNFLCNFVDDFASNIEKAIANVLKKDKPGLEEEKDEKKRGKKRRKKNKDKKVNAYEQQNCIIRIF